MPSAMNSGKSTRNSYSSLGLAKWGNLPGTLTEVKAIKNTIRKADLYTGEDVNESGIKRLSEKGDLKKYKVLQNLHRR